MRRRRLAITVVVSLLLHAALIVGWRARYAAAPRAKAAERPVEIVIVTGKTPSPPTRVVQPPQRPESRLSRPRSDRKTPVLAPGQAAAAETPSPVGGTPSSGKGSPAASTRGPDLFAPDAVERGAATHPAPELSGAALGQARLDAWAKDFAAAQRAQHQGMPPGMVELAQRLGQWFIPDDIAIERAAPFGLGAASQLESYRRYYADIAEHGLKNSDAPQSLRDRDRKHDPNASAAGIKFCFGQCTNVGHEVASLAVIIQIDHDESGAPAAWKIFTSSGDQIFDAAAVAAVKDARPYTDAIILKTPPAPLWSRWQLSQHAYRWTRAELMMDPGWTPPGMEIERESGILGKTTVTREVRLVAIEYRTTE